MRERSEKLTFRLTPAERAEGREAIRLQADAWKGESTFARAAFLGWARRELADRALEESRRRGRTPHTVAEQQAHRADQAHARGRKKAAS
jgi:hypothetical protein